MKVVTSVEEIRNNMLVLDSYLDKKADPKYSWAVGRIRKGTCFIANEDSGKCRFYPSRFVGYVDNSMDKHDNNVNKDGRETNKAIDQIIGTKCEPNVDLEKKYVAYCELLGFTPGEKGSFGVERKYWKI